MFECADKFIYLPLVSDNCVMKLKSMDKMLSLDCTYVDYFHCLLIFGLNFCVSFIGGCWRILKFVYLLHVSWTVALCPYNCRNNTLFKIANMFVLCLKCFVQCLDLFSIEDLVII